MDRMRQMELEVWLTDEIARRRGLGEYNPDAKTIQKMLEVVYELVRVASDTPAPAPRTKVKRRE